MVLGMILLILAGLTGAFYLCQRQFFAAAVGVLQEDKRFHLHWIEVPDESLARAANNLVSHLSRLKREEAAREAKDEEGLEHGKSQSRLRLKEL